MPSRPVFFVQNNHVQKLTAPVAIFARTNEIALEDRSSYVGFDPDHCGIEWSQYDLVLPYGSVQFIRQLEQSNLRKFVLHDEQSFATSYWSDILKNRALNADGEVMKVSDINLLFNGNSFHIRPNRIGKAFNAAVFNKESWLAVQNDRTLAHDLECWVAPVKRIDAEWRCWVIGGKIEAICIYRKNNESIREPETSPEVWSHAQELADIYVPAPCVVLDMAYTNNTFKLIEYNAIHTAGWYAADVRYVLSQWLHWSLKQNYEMLPGLDLNQNMTL